jgi:hypothetical protein
MLLWISSLLLLHWVLVLVWLSVPATPGSHEDGSAIVGNFGQKMHGRESHRHREPLMRAALIGFVRFHQCPP